MSVIKQNKKVKVTDLRAYIYAGDIMIWGDSVKELEIRLAHWGRESPNYGLQIKLEKIVMLRLLRKEEKTIMKVSKSKMNQVDRFTYLGSVVEQNNEIQNEIIRKATQFRCLMII
jgi:hypothetical protein